MKDEVKHESKCLIFYMEGAVIFLLIITALKPLKNNCISGFEIMNRYFQELLIKRIVTFI